MKKLFFLCLAAAFFIGCGEEATTKTEAAPKAEEPIKTAEYYYQHQDEMRIKVDECKKAQTMTERQEKECENVRKAKGKIASETGIDIRLGGK